MSIKINPNLVWDYDIPTEDEQTEAFRKWYLARVLSRGNADDLREVGIDLIYDYFPSLKLPAKIRNFWGWYFELPEVKAQYGATHTISA
ncbi:MAG: hypothetical protein DRI32_04730 [Chloroflexi bacterium]|nr:MAG: hypothetical protein DRI32_04730 [Chloroflexota bacterium]